MLGRNAAEGVLRTVAELREVNADPAAVAETERRLTAAARESGCWISADGRIGEADVAALLGITQGALANKRREGSAPLAYELGGGRHRVTYRLGDVARWIEAHRVR